jgi:hypothetical protein
LSAYLFMEEDQNREDIFIFEMGWAPASPSVDARNLLLMNWIFKVYRSGINEGWYKNQPPKKEGIAKQTRHHVIS